MSLIDRTIRSTRSELEPMEGLIGCVQGREAGGRRRLVAIATDRRVLVVAPRRSPRIVFDYEDITSVTSRLGSEGPTLRIEIEADALEVVHVTDERALNLFVQLVAARCASQPFPREAPQRVRIIA